MALGPKNGLTDVRRRLNNLSMLILLAFGLIAAALVYWIVVQGPEILIRDDNPRLVEAELRVKRGDILDVNNSLLASTRGQDAELKRYYGLPAAAPVVGYYSFRYGTSGIEEAYDALLRGESGDFWSDFWQIDVLAEPQTGRDIRLTLDSRWQAEADALLGDQNGAVLLFSLPDLAIRAMASQPGYDPNQLEDDFEQLTSDDQAPLLNRVTQGQYQPGLLLQPFIMAIAQRDDLIDLGQQPGDSATEVVVSDRPLRCQGQEPEVMTWGQALNARCPGPMLDLGKLMGNDGLLKAFEAFGLNSQPELEIVADSVELGTIADVEMAAIGQDVLAVSPLQVGLALATLANGGQFKPAQLVVSIEDEDGDWRAVGPANDGTQIVPESVANEILEHFSTFEGIREHSLVVLSGPDGGSNGWYLGLAPAEVPRYGVVVVIEDSDSPQAAQAVGRSLLKSVLDPER